MDRQVVLERGQLIREYRKEALSLARHLASETGRRPSDYVVVVADVRDAVGWRWARDIGPKTEEQLRAHLAPYALSTAPLVPTITFTVLRAAGIGLLDHDSPEKSKELAHVPADRIGFIAISAYGFDVAGLEEG